MNGIFRRTTGAAGAAVAILLALAWLSPVHAGHSKMQRVDEHRNGQTVKLAAGEFLEIVLAENPTTGYRWHLAGAGAPQCVLKQDAFEPGDEGVPGKGGIHRWQFQAAEPGAGRIELLYRRSWERDASPGRTFRLQVEVRKGVQEEKPVRPSE